MLNNCRVLITIIFGLEVTDFFKVFSRHNSSVSVQLWLFFHTLLGKRCFWENDVSVNECTLSRSPTPLFVWNFPCYVTSGESFASVLSFHKHLYSCVHVQVVFTNLVFVVDKKVNFHLFTSCFFFHAPRFPLVDGVWSIRMHRLKNMFVTYFCTVTYSSAARWIVRFSVYQQLCRRVTFQASLKPEHLCPFYSFILVRKNPDEWLSLTDHCNPNWQILVVLNFYFNPSF